MLLLRPMDPMDPMDPMYPMDPMRTKLIFETALHNLDISVLDPVF